MSILPCHLIRREHAMGLIHPVALHTRTRLKIGHNFSMDRIPVLIPSGCTPTSSRSSGRSFDRITLLIPSCYCLLGICHCLSFALQTASGGTPFGLAGAFPCPPPPAILAYPVSHSFAW